ncbi:type II toxin-antitoxin system HicA family toxin [Patulibacter defluvii]|uniref:type II toxin-antitoxin system HicA family toxin n=1 Tax=Patulibacter defluvii TaxID=3095358 RepID=UPI002A74EA1B|nr:type II toxin-antitoxin system HicA family toxin [Patulibacter sp. DM4]
MAKKYRDVRRILRQNGWTMVRVTGSHERWRGPDGRSTSVPAGGHGNQDMTPGTLSAIRRDTGIEELR